MLTLPISAKQACETEMHTSQICSSERELDHPDQN